MTMAPSIEILQLVSSKMAWEYRVIPVNIENSSLVLSSDQTSLLEHKKAELQLLLGKQVMFRDAPSDLIQQQLQRYYRKSASSSVSISFSSGSGTPENFLDAVIQETSELGSSDIHIEAFEKKARIRIRIDGHLVEKYSLPKVEFPALVNKIKIKANLDIAEKRLPQDGRIQSVVNGKKLDVRVSILPTLHGEKIVMRLLQNDASHVQIEKLGMSEAQLQLYTRSVKRTQGIILISGPTGSGKTTTLYATLKELNQSTVNVSTVEDPIEYTLQGINQVQVNSGIGMTFAAALKSFLRQDPDIIMLGEIRDAETANMAIRAALTGHLVLSTIHTNSSIGTIDRLIDMGVPAFLVGATIKLSVAQRLVRLLCPNCKQQSTEGIDFKKLPYAVNLGKVWKANGCAHCHETGYVGRQAIYEMLEITPNLQAQIKNGDIRNAIEIKTLQDQVLELVRGGITSFDEALPILLDQMPDV